MLKPPDFMKKKLYYTTGYLSDFKPYETDAIS